MPRETLRDREQVYKRTMDRFSKAIFQCSIIVLAVLFGSVGALFDWFPHPQLAQALGGIRSLSENWKNDLELEPTRHLVPVSDPERKAYRVLLPDEMTPGNVLIGGLTPTQEHLQGVTLYGAEGEVLHRWNIDYDTLDPEGNGEYNVMLHGVAAYPDGSLIVAFDAGKALARIDACGASIWVDNASYHHSVDKNEDGTVWTWRDEKPVRVNIENGEELESFDLRPDVVKAHDMYGSLAIRTLETKDSFKWFDDPFHGNDVEALKPSMATAFKEAGFAAGDLLISLRELNLVGVIDPATQVFKWYRHGPWFKQHDPDFQPDGTITVFDNRMGLDHSRILRIDPVTEQVDTLVADTQATPFYSWRRGKHQVLENGNILVTDAESGRVFEATQNGQLVWERNMIYDADNNYIVTSAEHLPENFFQSGVLDCAAEPS